MRSTALWGLLAAGALVATVVLAVALKARLKGPPDSVSRGESPRLGMNGQSLAPSGAEGTKCQVPQVVTVRAMPAAEDPPVLLWAVGEVRIFVDGVPAFSAPEAPKHFKLGVHALRVEAPGREPLSTQLRLDAFAPALFHAEDDPRAGITLVRVGSFCEPCRAPLDVVTLDYQRTSVQAEVLFERAAAALRRDDWMAAATFLRGVPLPAREGELFHRLAAATYADGFQNAKSRAELDAIPAAAAHDLKGLLGKYDALKASEASRRAQVVRARWNRVTERFQGLIDRFNTQAPGATAAASRRLADLSASFIEAAKREDVLEQERILGAAEEALLSVVVEVRAARPNDCEFQGRVVAAAMR